MVLCADGAAIKRGDSHSRKVFVKMKYDLDLSLKTQELCNFKEEKESRHTNNS